MATFPQLFSLEGKDVWVFGGAGYLGRAAVMLLAQAGARVLCVDLEQRAYTFVESAGLGRSVTPAAFDVHDTRALPEFVSARLECGGVPHGMVVLTFASTAKKLEELSDGDFDEVCHGGLTSVFVLAREVGTQMARAGRGSIVLFSSMYGAVSPDPAAYAAPMNKNPVEYGVTKAGLVQMARYLAVHWGREGVRCNCVSPGPFPNPGVQREHPEFIERLARKSPMGRIGRAEEIAGAVLFLLSDAASYVNGHNLFVDGGWTAW